MFSSSNTRLEAHLRPKDVESIPLYASKKPCCGIVLKIRRRKTPVPEGSNEPAATVQVLGCVTVKYEFSGELCILCNYYLMLYHCSRLFSSLSVNDFTHRCIGFLTFFPFEKYVIRFTVSIRSGRLSILASWCQEGYGRARVVLPCHVHHWLVLMCWLQ